jgi:hypothetical protein
VQARTLESKFENASSWIDKEPCTPLIIDESIMETSEVVGGICLIYCACGGAAEVLQLESSLLIDGLELSMQVLIKVG